MKLFKCDICGREVGNGCLRPLFSDRRVEGVEEICGYCANELSVAKRAVEKAIDAHTQGWISKIVYRMLERYKS